MNLFTVTIPLLSIQGSWFFFNCSDKKIMWWEFFSWLCYLSKVAWTKIFIFICIETDCWCFQLVVIMVTWEWSECQAVITTIINMIAELIPGYHHHHTVVPSHSLARGKYFSDSWCEKYFIFLINCSFWCTSWRW